MPRSRIPWARVTAEFLAIFAGVTLSLLADDWRSGREERGQEVALLSSLHSDLEAEKAELENLLSRMETWDSAGAFLHRRLGGPPVSPDSVDSRFRPVIFYNTYRPVSAAYVNLKEGGQLPLVRDSELRAQITGYYEVQQDYMIQFYELIMDVYFDWRRVALAHVEIAPSEATGNLWPVEGFTYRTNWQRFSSDERVPPLLTDLSVMGGNFAARISAVLEENQRLRESVAGAL